MSYLSLGGTPDDGGDFMSPPGGRGSPGGGNANLSSLFGLNHQMNNNPSSNQSLTYTAPKPPGKAQAPSSKPSTNAAPGVAIAIAVTAYKYVNNQNMKQGKLGAALLKNVAAKDYKILMYITKQQPVCVAQINQSFSFIIQANNYASFLDDQKQRWTILFDSTQQLVDFSKQVCLAKFFGNPQPPDSSVIQDLTDRSTQAVTVETGDSLEMKYTGWLVKTDGTLGDVFDSNNNSEKTFRFKIGRGKVIKGWESGMLGMQKGGKRFLIIPPHLAYGSKSVGNKVPSNSTLAFEVDLLRVKQSRDNASASIGGSVESLPRAVAADTPPNQGLQPETAPAATNLTPNSSEETVKGRTASINDQLANISQDGGKNPGLVTRMARMGQAMLPVPNFGHQEGSPIGESLQSTSSNSYLGEYPNQQTTMQQLSTAQPPASNSPQPMQQQAMQQQAMQQQAMQQQQQQQQQPVSQQHIMQQAMMQQSMQQPMQQAMMQQPPQFHQSPMHQQQMQQQSQMHHVAPSISQYPPLSQGYLEQPSVMSSRQQPSVDVLSQYNPYSGYRQMQQIPTSHGYGSEFLPILVSESRQQSSELRLLQEKVDKVSNIVQEVKKNTDESLIGLNQPTTNQTMDATSIMHNIQRIIEENEKLKQTVAEKTNQIENQNEKISDLLQQNQKHVEKSNLMLEQRNDSFKESFNQSQARSLQLEQDKVDLTQRLSDATAKVSELTLEVSNAKQRELDLKQKFKEIYMKEKERADEAEDKIKELEEEISTRDKAAEKYVSNEKTLKSEIEELRLKIENLSNANEKLSKEHSEQTDRWQTEKKTFEASLLEKEALYTSRIEEMNQSAMNDNSRSDQLSKTISSLQEKLLVAETKLQEVSDENTTNEGKVETLVQRYGMVRNAFEEQRVKLDQAIAEAEENSSYKEGYERIRGQATMMKQKYEAKVVELQAELAEKANSESSEDSGKSDIVTEVKKIMNSIFQQVKQKVDPDTEYTGYDVIKIMLEIIKSTTLSILNKNQQSDETKEESSDEEDDDEEDDDEGDDDEVDGGEEDGKEVVIDNDEGKEKISVEVKEDDIKQDNDDEKELEEEDEEHKSRLVEDFKPTEVSSNVETSDQDEAKEDETEKWEILEHQEKQEDEENAAKDKPVNVSEEGKVTEDVHSTPLDDLAYLSTKEPEKILEDEAETNPSEGGESITATCKNDDSDAETIVIKPVEDDSNQADCKDISFTDKNETPPQEDESAPGEDITSTAVDEGAEASDLPKDISQISKASAQEKDSDTAAEENNMDETVNDPALNKEKVEVKRASSVTLSRSSSYDDRKPPPLFDDDSDSDDLDWFK